MAIVPAVIAKKNNQVGINFPGAPGYVLYTNVCDTEIADTEGNGFVGPSSTNIYARVAGMYIVYADIEYYLSGGRNKNYDVKLNGSTSILGSSQNTNAGSAGKGTARWGTSALWKFNANDYLILYTDTRQDNYYRDLSEGAVNIRGGLGLAKVASGIGARVSAPSGPGTVSWSNEVFDDGNLHDISNDTRLTAPSNGLYYISSQIRWQPDDQGYPVVPYVFPNISTSSNSYDIDGDNRSASIRLNGSGIIAKDSRHGGLHDTRQYFLTNINHHLSCIYQLNAGDYVELVLDYVGGTNHTLLSDCFFCMAKLD